MQANDEAMKVKRLNSIRFWRTFDDKVYKKDPVCSILSWLFNER